MGARCTLCACYRLWVVGVEDEMHVPVDAFVNTFTDATMPFNDLVCLGGHEPETLYGEIVAEGPDDARVAHFTAFYTSALDIFFSVWLRPMLLRGILTDNPPRLRYTIRPPLFHILSFTITIGLMLYLFVTQLLRGRIALALVMGCVILSFEFVTETLTSILTKRILHRGVEALGLPLPPECPPADPVAAAEAAPEPADVGVVVDEPGTDDVGGEGSDVAGDDPYDLELKRRDDLELKKVTVTRTLSDDPD